jgi:peptidoglycan/LPS O-acetylase OafA/YrhL
MVYRAEIDGLRALAVVPVILFHAGFHLFSGGFVGVDVFFVISGYLITTIIVQEMDAGRFSLTKFYIRRAKRILPALFFVMLACIPMAAIFFLPIAMKDFSQSLIAVSAFASNILFLTESGYFEQAAELKPLLHTWSLAVEEQYYIIFPLLLMILWWLGRRWIIAVLAIMCLLSLAAAEWAAHNSPAAAFYLLPMRAWELLIGVFAALYLQHSEMPLSHMVKQAGSVFGLALIIVAIFSYDETTPFPGFYALLPTVGTALVILFAVPGTWVNKLLSFKLFVGLGLISYSAYLWHQPLFAFARYHSPFEPSAMVMLGLSFVTLPLAFLSWRYVETPFRRPELPAMTVFGGSAAVALGFIVIGFLGNQSEGFKDQILTYRLSDEQRSLYMAIRSSIEYDLSNASAEDRPCQIRVPDADALDMEVFQDCVDAHGLAFVILGDSHALNLYNIVARADIKPFVIAIAKGGCRVHDRKPTCAYDDLERFLSEQRHSIAKVVYHQSGAYFVKDRYGRVDSQDAFTGEGYSFAPDTIADVAAYLDELRAKNDLDVAWLGPFLEYRYRPRDGLKSPAFLSVNPYSAAIFAELEPLVVDIVSGIGTVPYTSFDDVYKVQSDAFVGDCFMFRDGDHFSRCAEELISQEPSFIDFLRGL